MGQQKGDFTPGMEIVLYIYIYIFAYLPKRIYVNHMQYTCIHISMHINILHIGSRYMMVSSMEYDVTENQYGGLKAAKSYERAEAL